MVLAKILMLFNISKLQPMERELRLKEMVEEREKDMSFDPSWMVDHSERPELESTAVKVQPLANNPGRVMLTNKRLYFQPMNNISANPVERFALSSITSLSKRRHHLRDVGVEIFMENETSLLLAFKTPSERDTFSTKLLSQTETRIRENNDLFVMMKQWQEGLVSNYDYLMFLNRMAGRSCNDLTQYPVFPWVISKYDSKTLDLNDPSTFRDLSKPIGALNHQRLTQFRVRIILHTFTLLIHLFILSVHLLFVVFLHSSVFGNS
jgi:factor associated with neutral sphingomyelinase activation